MTIEFRCPGCDKLLRTTVDKAGLSANCPECGELVQIPIPAQESHGGRFGAASDLSGFAPLPSARTSSAYAAALDERVPQSTAAAAAPTELRPTRACPVCGEQIAVAAVLCRFCRSTVGVARSRHSSTSTNGLALASMIMGITSIPMMCAAFFMGIPLGIAAVTTGLIAWKQCGRGEGTGREFAVVGIICGTLPSLIGAAIVAWLLMLARMPF